MEAKTKFYNEIAKKLCGFSEEVERENYTEAVAEKYNISMESLKKLVTGYAAKMGMAAEVIRPKQPVQQKNREIDDRWHDQAFREVLSCDGVQQ